MKYFIIVLLLLPLISTSQSSKAKRDSSEMQQLQLRKLKLETLKIEKETRSLDYSPWLQSGTLIAALTAAAISLYSNMRSQKIQLGVAANQVKQHQKDKISTLLKELGSNEVSVKVASILALSEYESAFPFLTNLIKFESDASTLSAITKTLKKNSSFSIGLIIEETATLYHERLKIACLLIDLGENRREVSEKLGLNNKTLLDWYENKYQNRYKAVQSFQFNDVTPVLLDVSVEKAKLKDLWARNLQGHYNLTAILEDLIKVAVSKGLRLELEGGVLNGLRLANLNLKGWTFRNCVLNDCFFIECDLSEAKFEDISATNLWLRNSTVADMHFVRSEVKVGNFKEIKGQRVFIVESTFFKVDFTGSNLRKSTYTRSKWSMSDFRAIMLSGSHFEDCVFYDVEFFACFLAEAKFVRGKFMESKFKTAKFLDSEFDDFDFYKLDIRKSSFENVKFSNLKWQNLDVIDCNLSNAEFNTVDFVNVNVDAKTIKNGIKLNSVTTKSVNGLVHDVG